MTNNKNTTYIGLIDPKSPTNVGSVMRAAGCYAVDSVFYSGDRYTFAKQFNTDTQNARHKIPLTQTEHLLNNVKENMSIVCVDLIEGATPLPEFKHPENAIYIFGPEDGSISQSIIDAADHAVYVPTIGCMNLAATVNVLLYDKLAKSLAPGKNDELIRKSRDTNNRTIFNKTAE